MARATLKVAPETAARLRAAMVGLSGQAGRILTIDGAINYMLDALQPVEAPPQSYVRALTEPTKWATDDTP